LDYDAAQALLLEHGSVRKALESRLDGESLPEV